MKYEIWLGNNSTHFDHGVAVFDDGRTEPLDTFCNVGIQQNSLLIGIANEYGEIDDQLRWYPMPGVIDFYVWSKDLDGLTFHNTSDHDIYICGYAYLKPGESTEIQNQYGQKHTDWLRRTAPIGLGRLIETSHIEEGYQELVGKYGLILFRMSREDPFKTVLRFVLADALMGAAVDTEGFETSAGKLTYDENGHMVMQTERSRCVFAYDKGDNHDR